MPEMDRRTFLQAMGAALGVVAVPKTAQLGDPRQFDAVQVVTHPHVASFEDGIWRMSAPEESIAHEYADWLAAQYCQCISAYHQQ